MALDPWPFLSVSPNISIPEPLLYDSYIQGNESEVQNITETRESHQDKTSSVVITFIYFMVCAVGLCGNTLVIYVILRYAKMKTVTNIYILNLAVADVLCMMSLPFIALQLALVHWPFGEALCRVIMTVERPSCPDLLPSCLPPPVPLFGFPFSVPSLDHWTFLSPLRPGLPAPGFPRLASPPLRPRTPPHHTLPDPPLAPHPSTIPPTFPQ